MMSPDTPDDLLDDAEMERLLASIIHDGVAVYPRRAELRSRMLSEFDLSDLEETSPVPHSDGQDIDQLATDGLTADIIDLRQQSRHDRRPKRFGLELVAVAAALLVIVGFSVLQRTDGPTEIHAADGESTMVPEDASLPAVMAAGEHRTEVVGGGVQLELPAGVEVLEEEAGRLVLGRLGDQSNPRASVSIVNPGEDETLLDLITELEAEGFVTPIESVTAADGKFTTEWELRITNEAAAEFDCVQAGPCVPLGPIELWSRGVNYVAEIVGPDGEVVWWVEQSSIHLDPFLEEATQIQGTLRFD